MLTDRDMTMLLSVFATKEEMQQGFQEIREEMSEMRHEMLQAMDGLVTPFERFMLEYVAVKDQTTRHERWIKRIAKKTEVALKD